MNLKVDIEKDFGSFKLKSKFETSELMTAFLGASGAGKSITLKCIAGIIKPDKGHIELNGRVLFDSEKKINLRIQDRKVGYFFQNYALFPNMSAKRNIYQGMHRFKKDFDKEAEYEKVVKLLSIGELSKQRPYELSGGQQQRVALARILVNQPEIILLDEPFSALDEHLRTKLQIEMREVLKKLNKQAILVTHNRDEAYMLSEHTVLIDKGVVVEEGPTKELFKNPKQMETALITGCKNIVKCSLLLNKINAENWGVSFENPTNKTNFNYIGIRAHDFDPKEKQNSFEIEVLDVIEQPFENLVRFKYKNQKDNTALYWFVPKSDIDYQKIKKIGVKTEKLLLLK